MSLIENLIYFVSVISNLGLGFFVFFQGKKRKVNQLFFACILAATAWLVSLFLFNTIESATLVLWMGRFNFAVVIPLLYFLFKFAILFPRQTIFIPKCLNKVLNLWILVFSLLILFTPIVGKEEIIVGPGVRETIYGPSLNLYILHYLIFSVFIIIHLFLKKRKGLPKEEAVQVNYVLIGLFLALIWGIITTIGLSLVGMFEISHYAPLATIIFSGFVATAILRHCLFDIKVIATEFFVILLVFILLISLFISQTQIQRILNIVIFVGASFFGIFLIKSVILEIKIREESQKLARDLEKAYAELKKLDIAKTEFISIASHQLRTPLTIIKGYISMMLEGTYGRVAQKAQKPLENVLNSNERLIRLVNDLLMVSKVETGKIEVELSKVNLEEIIVDLIKELELKAKEKKIYLRLEKSRKPLPLMMIDKDKIRQTIFNILDNGIRYTNQGGLTVTLKKLDSRVRIIIKDTGEGMSGTEARRLFSSFSRGSAGVKLWAEGAGLGLYIAKKFIDFHHGRIWAGSPGKGKGSTFFIELPIY